MKQLFLAILLYTSLPLFSQGGKVIGQRAVVTNWGSRAIILLNDKYFLETKDSIIAQIGQEEFDIMKDKCSKSGWPADGLYRTDLNEEDDRRFDSLLNTLNMYSIASYTHIYNGTRFDRYVILRIPYEENKQWDQGVKWEGNVYFLLKEKDVRLL